MKKVSVILVNWNGLHYLKKCLPTLTKSSYSNYEIIVTDNASSDGSTSYLTKYYPKVKIVRNKENLGFAGGNNEAMKEVTGEYILLLNNDTIVTKDLIKNLVERIEEDKSIGVVQAKILSMDNSKRLDSVGAFLTNTGFLYHYGYYQYDKKIFDKTINLYSAKGAGMLIRKNLIDKLGLFDDTFFAYFEETDFCHRVWLAGYKIVYAPKAVLYHKIGGTSNKMNNAFIQYHSFKNRIRSYIKNLGTEEMIKILPLHILLCEAAGISFIFKKRFDLFIAINKAIYWNIIHLDETLKLRHVIQYKYRKVSDEEIMPLLKRKGSLKYYYYLFAKNLVGYKETF